jgi:hypothetical protein
MSYLYLALHYPKPDHLNDLLAAMQRLNDALQDASGLFHMGAMIGAKPLDKILLLYAENTDSTVSHVKRRKSSVDCVYQNSETLTLLQRWI